MHDTNHLGDEPSKAVQSVAEALRLVLDGPATFFKGKAQASQIRSIAKAQSDASEMATQARIRDEARLLEHHINLDSIVRKAAQQIYFKGGDAPELLSFPAKPDERRCFSEADAD